MRRRFPADFRNIGRMRRHPVFFFAKMTCFHKYPFLLLDYLEKIRLLWRKSALCIVLSNDKFVNFSKKL